MSVKPTTRNVGDSEPLFEGFEAREAIGLPPTYLVGSPGVLYPARRMLRLAGCKSGARCPMGWRRLKPGSWVQTSDGRFLLVSKFGRGQHHGWTVERCTGITREALVCGLGYAPVWGRSRREAMFLAEFCSGRFGLQLTACCWRDIFS